MARPDRALRRQVALLQELDEGDRLGVLELLGESEREQVLALLAGGELRPAPRGAADAPEGTLVLPEGLSPWLCERLGQADAAGGESFAITAHCQQQLRACIAELVPQPARPRPWFARLSDQVKRRLPGGEQAA